MPKKQQIYLKPNFLFNQREWEGERQERDDLKIKINDSLEQISSLMEWIIRSNSFKNLCYENCKEMFSTFFHFWEFHFAIPCLPFISSLFWRNSRRFFFSGLQFERHWVSDTTSFILAINKTRGLIRFLLIL